MAISIGIAAAFFVFGFCAGWLLLRRGAGYLSALEADLKGRVAALESRFASIEQRVGQEIARAFERLTGSGTAEG